jgi:serine/threonine-protein kinase
LDRTTDKKVAIKILAKRLAQDGVARAMFELEARVAGRVESEHVVQVSDAGIDPMSQMPFLVMEFLKGKDFNELIACEGPLEPTQALQYLAQAASGLEKAHGWCRDGKASPIVHRDLKPENLYLTHREDGTPLVKILDWGIAKVLTGSATLSQDLRGTPLYMAPEQLSPAPVTPATDVWALGLLAHFLLTGKCYWKSAQRDNIVLPAIIKEVCEGPVELPSVQMQQLGVCLHDARAFDDWFMRCVNLDPAQRYQRAGEAVRALSSALGFSPDQYAALTSSNRLTPVSRDRSPLSNATNAALLPPADPGVMSQSPQPAAQNRARWSPLLWPAMGLAIGASVAWVSLRHTAHEPGAALATSGQSPVTTATQASSQTPTNENPPAESTQASPSAGTGGPAIIAPPASGPQSNPDPTAALPTRRVTPPNTAGISSGKAGTYREDRLLAHPRHPKP